MITTAAFSRLVKVSSTVTFECHYDEKYFIGIGEIYICGHNFFAEELDDKEFHIDAEIKIINGTHNSNKTVESVQAIDMRNRVAKRFPRELGDFFLNVKAISFQRMELKELYKSDLKPFLHLMLLDLYDNELTILEKDLFEFTPVLQFLYLHHNKIIFIDLSFVNTANSLSTLFISNNKCTSSHDHSDIRPISFLIEAIKENCTDLNAFCEQNSNTRAECSAEI